MTGIGRRVRKVLVSAAVIAAVGAAYAWMHDEQVRERHQQAADAARDINQAFEDHCVMVVTGRPRSAGETLADSVRQQVHDCVAANWQAAEARLTTTSSR